MSKVLYNISAFVETGHHVSALADPDRSRWPVQIKIGEIDLFCTAEKAIALRDALAALDLAALQTRPCDGGRCTDPAAHAEGAHDL